MKILQINAVNSIRSTGRQVEELSDYINENGHEGFIAFSFGPSYYKGYLIGNLLDRKIHGFLSRVSGKQAYFSKWSTQKLLNWIDKISPDVVHLNNLHGNYINLEMLMKYLALNDISTVITLHDCWFYTGKCTHYTTDNCYKWKEVCGNCPRLKMDNKSWFFDRTSNMLADKKGWFDDISKLAIVGVSDWIKDEAEKSILDSAKIITRIYNWIDLKHFKPITNNGMKEELGIESKFIILGVASKWSKSKGLNSFLELADRISQDMIIVIVGNISEEVNLPPNIINIKETNNIEELVKIYSMSDVFLNFSLEESFGKVVAEALACGIPIITNNYTANPELIGSGCGYKYDDYQCLMEKIKIIRENGKEFYSSSCIEFARSNFDSDERMNDYMKLYFSLVESEDGQ